MLTTLRNWAVFTASVLALFWLQPAAAIRFFDFWLPVGTLALIAIVWSATQPQFDKRDLLIDAGALCVLILAVASLRFVEALSTALTRTRPPELMAVVLAVLTIASVGALAGRARSRPATWAALIGMFLLMLVVVKTDALAAAASAAFRALQGQGIAQASALDWRWLGFSYVAFRMIGSLRERMNNKLPAMRLREFVSYAVFAPALSAGPIDRADRFLNDLRTPYAPGRDLLAESVLRVLTGAFKKYALADTLALIALNDANAPALRPGWAWLPLYAYALRIYFDFSGYTDIALGIARALGVKLPENFNAPYLKPNLTQFWNSWHMSLAQWFRAYWFNPLTRALRIRKWEQAPIVLTGQVSTMLLIGLWHGVTPNFLIWGVWHALGLFAHNRWADFAKTRLAWVGERPRLQRAVNVAGALLTFHFVALGWVWFALSTPAASLQLLARLFWR